VVIVNPYNVKRRKEEVDNSPNKNDRKDAGIIAKLVKDVNFLHCLLPKGKYAELRNLTVTRRQQRRKLNNALNQKEASNHRVVMKRAQALYKTAQESIGVTEGLTGAQ
jgi:hypothetical protein